jgi:hypothetical protein
MPYKHAVLAQLSPFFSQTLASLRSLKALNVCRNEINSLDGVKECKSLCKLLIESNKLPSVKELIKLQNLSNLVVVTIKGNMPM